IGTGGQGGHHIRGGLAGTEDAIIVAVCDVFELHQKNARQLAAFSNAKVQLAPGETYTPEQLAKAKAAGQPPGYYDYREMRGEERVRLGRGGLGHRAEVPRDRSLRAGWPPAALRARVQPRHEHGAERTPRPYQSRGHAVAPQPLLAPPRRPLVSAERHREDF